MTDPTKAIEYVQHHIEKEIRALLTEEQEYRDRGSDTEKVEEFYVAKWLRERKELEEGISESFDTEIRISLAGRAIALNWLLQHKFGVEGLPGWTPEIEYFNGFIDYSATYDRIRSEFEED